MTEAQARARTVQLSLHGDITEATERQFVDDLARLERQGAPRVDLYISSGGGSVLSGLGLYSALARYPGKVDTRVDGVAASMAGVIFLVGERRRISRSGWLMLHSPWLSAEGNSAVLRETAATLDRLGSSLRDIVASRSGQPDETVASWLSQESWWDGESSLRDGLATELLDGVPKAALASIPLTRFRAVPAALAAAVTKENIGMSTTADAAAATAGGHDALNDAVMLERSSG